MTMTASVIKSVTPKTQRKIRWNRYSVLRYTILIVLTLIALVPFITLLMVSFKTHSDFMKYPLRLPQTLSLQNYLTVLKRSSIVSSFLNSLIITAGSLAIELFVGTLASYAITKMSFKRAGFFSALFLVPMIFPV